MKRDIIKERITKTTKVTYISEQVATLKFDFADENISYRSNREIIGDIAT